MRMYNPREKKELKMVVHIKKPKPPGEESR
jgi:hypothetical protein